MQQRHTLLAIAISLSASTWATADALSSEERLEKAEQRIQYLEQRMQSQDTAANNNDNWADVIEIGGLIEVETSVSDPDAGSTSSDTVVATVELGLAATISEQLSVEIGLLYEEDETDLEVDIAQFTYALSNSNWAFTAGQTYIPFGAYETALVSSPLTLELGETRESALIVSYDNGSLNSTFYAYNGTNKDGGVDRINNWGSTIGYTNDVISVGFGYVNDLSDSDTIQAELDSTTVADYTAGATANIAINAGAITIIAEQVSALDSFVDAPLAGEKPKARNIEVDYSFKIAGKPSVLAIAAQSTEQASALDLPEDKKLIGLGLELSENVGLGIEYSTEDDYDGASTNNVVIQAAISF